MAASSARLCPSKHIQYAIQQNTLMAWKFTRAVKKLCNITRRLLFRHVYKPNYTTDVSAGRYFNSLVKRLLPSKQSICWEETNVLLDFVPDSDFSLTKQDPEPWPGPADDALDQTKSFNYTHLFNTYVLVTTFPQECFWAIGLCFVYYAQYD